jgi:hypothetical protein
MSIIATRGRIAIAAAIGLTALAAADAGAATDRRFGVEAAAGGWDIALDDTSRRCRLMLRAEATGAAHALAMPAGCRRALPILAGAGGWRPGDQARLALLARDGGVLLDFAPDGKGGFAAQGPEGETYRIAPADPGQRERLAQTAPGFQSPRPAAAPAAPAATGAVALPPATPATMPGRYAVLREEGRDTGCMVTLEDKAKGPRGSVKAFLAPACRDNGIVIFDPAGWSLDRGRLVLFARKGHTAHFDRQPDGAWLKDPKQGGKPLGLRRL